MHFKDTSYLVVSGKRKDVVGRYFNLEQAKDILHQIAREVEGYRMILEVHGHDGIQNDPSVVSGQPQNSAAGFNNSWGDWNGIRWMQDIAKTFLVNVKGELY